MFVFLHLSGFHVFHYHHGNVQEIPREEQLLKRELQTHREIYQHLCFKAQLLAKTKIEPSKMKPVQRKWL